MDAIVATALCAGVVQPAGSGLGGGGFAVVRSPGGEVMTLDFRESAPAAATRDMFLDEEGEVRPGAANVGGLAVATPSESRGLAALLDRWGTQTPRQVARPAIRLASRGFRAGPHLLKALARESSEAVQRELAVGGEPAVPGDLIRRPALARTLRRWARSAGEDLHTGRGADAIVAAVQEAGGVLTAEDLADYAVVDRAPVTVSFRNHTIVSMGPPSSGGLLLAQMLRVLDGVDLSERHAASTLHRLVETMKHAYADRTRLGDPMGMTVAPDTLLDPARISAIRADFDPTLTHPPEHYGLGAAPPEDAGTQHLGAVDAAGWAVALTTTVNTGFGSGVVSAETGVILNDEMDDFAAAPGRPNAYGLVQGEANAVRPGARPLSSMTPTLVLDPDGQPVMVVGASGGSTIITAVLQVLLDVLVYGIDPDDAVSAPRIHHQWRPDRLWVEPRLSPDTRAALEAFGHTLFVRPGFSAVQVLVRGEDGRWTGAADPRKGGAALPAWGDR